VSFIHPRIVVGLGLQRADPPRADRVLGGVRMRRLLVIVAVLYALIVVAGVLVVIAWGMSTP
jgi:hypothetical protein